MKFSPITLPFEKTDLEPYMSKETVEFHYEKHHMGYAKTLDTLMTTTAKNLEKYETLEELIKNEKGKPYNLAAQILNHDLFFLNLHKNTNGEIPKPTGKLLEEINKSWGSFDEFKKQFTASATAHFGSGWCWLVFNPESKKLEIIDTHDAENPLSKGLVPLMNVDVWEHAYYSLIFFLDFLIFLIF